MISFFNYMGLHIARTSKMIKLSLILLMFCNLQACDDTT